MLIPTWIPKVGSKSDEARVQVSILKLQRRFRLVVRVVLSPPWLVPASHNCPRRVLVGQ